MKKYLLILVLIANLLIFCGCPIAWEDFRNRVFETQNDFNYYPQKDTFNIGDTIWLQFSFPKNIKNNEFDIIFENDTVNCGLSILLNKIDFFSDTTSLQIISINVEEDLFFKLGNYIKNSSNFYFIWNDESQKYVIEFGFVLKNTGKYFIAENNSKYENLRIFIQNVPGLAYNNDNKEGKATFYSTFQTTGEGWFQFVVVE